jgi:hypothetical protein
MKLDPGMHIGLHLVFFGKTGVTRAVLARWPYILFSLLLLPSPALLSLYLFIPVQNDRVPGPSIPTTTS